jgi:hypothetical protein
MNVAWIVYVPCAVRPHPWVHRRRAARPWRSGVHRAPRARRWAVDYVYELVAAPTLRDLIAYPDSAAKSYAPPERAVPG